LITEFGTAELLKTTIARMMMMMIIIMTTAWTVWDSNPSRGKSFFCSANDQTGRGAHFNRYRVYHLGVKRPGVEVDK
jgi:hypothetical protein